MCSLKKNHIKVKLPDCGKIRSRSYYRVLKYTWFSKQTMVTSLGSPLKISPLNNTILVGTTFFREKKGVLKIDVLKIYLKMCLFHNRPWRWRSTTLVKMNPSKFTFEDILYRVKTSSWDSKTFRSIYYPEIFSMADSGCNL